MQTLYITHPACRLHEMGQGHPECPERLDAISDQMLASGLVNYLQPMDVHAPASEQILRLVHGQGYMDELAAMAPSVGYRGIDPDTSMNPHTLEAARFAAGALVQAVDAVMAGQSQTAFCAVRPPGHHASAARAMGFCFLITSRWPLPTRSMPMD